MCNIYSAGQVIIIHYHVTSNLSINHWLKIICGMFCGLKIFCAVFCNLFQLGRVVVRSGKVEQKLCFKDIVFRMFTE